MRGPDKNFTKKKSMEEFLTEPLDELWKFSPRFLGSIIKEFLEETLKQFMEEFLKHATERYLQQSFEMFCKGISGQISKKNSEKNSELNLVRLFDIVSAFLNASESFLGEVWTV